MLLALPRSVAASAAMTVVLCVAACGGGGGAPAQAPPVPAPAPPAPPPPTPAPTALSYPTPVTLALNQSITPLRPRVTGLVDTYSIALPLPAGLSLDRVSGAISGTPTELAATLGYVVTATNSGGSISATLNLAVEQGRTTVDQPDLASSPYQVHPVYAIPTDRPDARLDTDGTIDRSLRSANAWFAGASSGVQRIRFDERLDGAIDVSFFALSREDNYYASMGSSAASAIGNEIRAAPLYEARKIYLVYYDGTNSAVSCGSGQRPGHFSALFMHAAAPGFLPCDTKAYAATATSPANYHEWAAVHEIVHNLGFVHSCAPHSSIVSGHTSDGPSDLMWVRTDASDGRIWASTAVDPGNDDYYGANVPAACPLNLFFSAFLEPTHGTQLPPGF